MEPNVPVELTDTQSLLVIIVMVVVVSGLWLIFKIVGGKS